VPPLLDDLDYALPPDRIADRPAPERDASRLLVLARDGAVRADDTFRSLPGYLRPGDALVVNESRVLPARVFGTKDPGGGRVEVLLVDRVDDTRWRALVRSAKRPRAGFAVAVAEGFRFTVDAYNDDGTCDVTAHSDGPIEKALERHGAMPLPPYIGRDADDADRVRYQTVYADAADPLGRSVAAPTAGLHFTESLLGEVEAAGVRVVRVSLDVGFGTFAPIRTEDVDAHTLHAERYRVSDEAADALDAVRADGGKILAVGTTSVRTLETVVGQDGRFAAGEGETRLFLKPGSAFRAIDGLVTNFHLPRSSLLVLVAAFLGREATLAAYAHAIEAGYRFYSYGDAMLVLPESR